MPVPGCVPPGVWRKILLVSAPVDFVNWGNSVVDEPTQDNSTADGRRQTPERGPRPGATRASDGRGARQLAGVRIWEKRREAPGL